MFCLLVKSKINNILTVDIQSNLSYPDLNDIFFILSSITPLFFCVGPIFDQHMKLLTKMDIKAWLLSY